MNTPERNSRDFQLPKMDPLPPTGCEAVDTVMADYGQHLNQARAAMRAYRVLNDGAYQAQQAADQERADAVRAGTAQPKRTAWEKWQADRQAAEDYAVATAIACRDAYREAVRVCIELEDEVTPTAQARLVAAREKVAGIVDELAPALAEVDSAGVALESLKLWPEREGRPSPYVKPEGADKGVRFVDLFDALRDYGANRVGPELPDLVPLEQAAYVLNVSEHTIIEQFRQEKLEGVVGDQDTTTKARPLFIKRASLLDMRSRRRRSRAKDKE